MKGPIMADVWEKIIVFNKQNLELNHPWLFVSEIGREFDALRLRAQGSWVCPGTSDEKCGPDGLARSTPPEGRPALATAPVGSLIGKLGGSSASAAADDTVFAIGSDCLMTFSDKKRRILFVTVNCAASQPPFKLESIKLEVMGGIDS